MKIIIESSHSYKPKCKNWCIPRHDSHLDSCETWLVYYSFRAHQLEIAILEVCVLHSLGHRYPFTVHLPHSSLSCHNISLQAELPSNPQSSLLFPSSFFNIQLFLFFAIPSLSLSVVRHTSAEANSFQQ